jgi:hypothetical protein
LLPWYVNQEPAEAVEVLDVVWRIEEEAEVVELAPEVEDTEPTEL